MRRCSIRIHHPSNAARVDVVAGQERSAWTFSCSLTQTSQIDGVVLSTKDAAPNATQITLVPKDSLPGLPGNTQSTRTEATGPFVPQRPSRPMLQ